MTDTIQLWKMKSLHSLELVMSGVSRFDWNDLCAVLESSPQLEVETVCYSSLHLADAFLDPHPT